MTIEIVARPGSQRHGLLRVEPRGLVIGIGSPAEGGKANAELIATMAKMAETTRDQVSIIRGAANRTKVIRIASTRPFELVFRLQELVSSIAK